MKLKIVYSSLILVLSTLFCGCDSGGEDYEVVVKNSLNNKVYYEINYYDIDKKTETAKSGDIESKQENNIGKIRIMPRVKISVYSFNVYKDSSKKEILYSYNSEKSEDFLIDDKIIFEISEEKINKY